MKNTGIILRCCGRFYTLLNSLPPADMIVPVAFEHDHWVNASFVGKYSTNGPEQQKT